MVDIHYKNQRMFGDFCLCVNTRNQIIANERIVDQLETMFHSMSTI